MVTMEPSQNTQPATQQATQPFVDPRRRHRTLSQMSNQDAANIICVLHPSSPMALAAVRATMLKSPEHILQNDDLDGITEDDLAVFPDLERRTREIALRMQSTVKMPKAGYRFGRNPDSCDVLLTPNPKNKLISNVQFRIYINDQGSLMIEDLSTNGTWLDDDLIKSKDKTGLPLAKHGKHALRNGNIITVLAAPNREMIKFLVRIPNRTECEDLYEQKLRSYLAMRGIEPRFTSIRESSFGNQWNGGSTYNFTGLLGKGAFATVYRVQTKSEGTLYAAKEIDKRRFVKNGVLDVRFDNELQIMQRLKHPNIVDYIDYQSFGNWIYIIMEYIPYGELSKDLADRGFLPEMEVQQITKQTLRALDHLHRQGITHRDIKPDNILISSRSPLIIKLSDFGLSKSVLGDETFLKTFCGTLLYCAPEVYPDYGTYQQQPSKRRRSELSRTLPYDSSADMWSFGAVIFHLMAGRAPIIGRGDNGGAQMLNNIMTKPVDFQPLLERGVTPTAIDFVAALLNRSPALRPMEKDCFNHVWLKNVPEVVDYSSVVDVDFRRRTTWLDDVEEEEEDADDGRMFEDLQQLTQNQGLQPKMSGPAFAPASPERPTKKPKIIRAESKIPEEILYPFLPAEPQPPATPAPSSKAPRLFGEITASILQSSGLFGGIGGSAESPAIRGGDLPQLSGRLEHVSMNNSAPISTNETTAKIPVPLEEITGDDHASYSQSKHAGGPAPSLLGAEAQMGEMNMGSPAEAASPNASTPKSDHPATPPGTALTSALAVSDSAADSNLSQPSTTSGKDRRIEIDLLTDDAAFAAEQELRQAAREENTKRKAVTFNTPNVIDFGIDKVGSRISRTFTTAAGTISANSLSHRPRSSSPPKVEVRRQLNPNAFSSSSRNFGRLMPVEGSFDTKEVLLTGRSTFWGRSPNCNQQYSNVKDTRIPKLGMKVVFFATGIENVEREGGDWTQVPKIRTIIATSATKGIKINGFRLVEESEDGKSALFGTLYNGDVITVVDSEQPGAYLKYRVEILFGGSAQERPEKERPFVVQKEYNHHALWKEHSIGASRLDDGNELVENT